MLFGADASGSSRACCAAASAASAPIPRACFVRGVAPVPHRAVLLRRTRPKPVLLRAVLFEELGIRQAFEILLAEPPRGPELHEVLVHVRRLPREGGAADARGRLSQLHRSPLCARLWNERSISNRLKTGES